MSHERTYYVLHSRCLHLSEFSSPHWQLVSDTWVRFVEVRSQVVGMYVEMRELMVFDDTGSNVAAGKATRASPSSSWSSAPRSVVDFIVTTGATGPPQDSTNNLFSTGPAVRIRPCRE